MDRAWEREQGKTKTKKDKSYGRATLWTQSHGFEENRNQTSPGRSFFATLVPGTTRPIMAVSRSSESDKRPRDGTVVRGREEKIAEPWTPGVPWDKIKWITARYSVSHPWCYG